MSEISILPRRAPPPPHLPDDAPEAKDPEIRKLFQDAADSAMKNRQDLMKFL